MGPAFDSRLAHVFNFCIFLRGCLFAVRGTSPCYLHSRHPSQQPRRPRLGLQGPAILDHHPLRLRTPFNESYDKDAHLHDRGVAMIASIEKAGMKCVMLARSFWYEFSLGGGSDRYGFDFKNKTLVLFDAGTVPINTTTWPQCGRAVAALLSLKEIPDDEDDQTPTLSQFANGVAYVSSFLISQRDMFESVKRVTGTTDEDWTVTKEPSGPRYQGEWGYEGFC